MPITPQGYEAETAEEIFEQQAAEARSRIANDLVLDDDDPLGQVLVINSDKHAENRSAIAVAYNAFDRGAAEGRLLDIIGDLVGIERDGAQLPRVIVRVGLTAGGAISVGDMLAPVGESSNAWYALEAFVAPSTGQFFRVFEASGAAQSVPSGVTWSISGVPAATSAANLQPSTANRARERDAAYRQRQDESLDRAGAGSSDSLATDLREVPGVLQATVYENPRSFDADGLPPHSFECVIYDGPTQDASNDAIAQVIWDNKPPGSAYAYGQITATAYDVDGQARSILFSRAVGLRLVITMTVRVLPGWQEAQRDALKTKIVEAFQLRRTGEDVPTLKAKGIASVEPFVYDVADYTQGIWPGPYTDTATVVQPREYATLAFADLTINVEQLPGRP